MQFDLRYAGLNPAMEQRLRLATTALAAHRMQARASEWDGTRCDMVAADPTDAYGRRVLEIARRRGTPALEIGPSTALYEPGATVARLTRALHELLLRASGNARAPLLQAPAAPHMQLASMPALVRLALDPALAGIDVEARSQEARSQNVVVWLLPSTGRVLSATVSDQLRARERLAVKEWSFTPITERQRAAPLGEVSASLDAFLLQGAWHARSELPPFSGGEVGLSDWPDLGSAASLVEALKVVQALQRSRGNAAGIARRCGLAQRDVDACLWAFKAAALLDDANESAPAAVPAAVLVAANRGGLLSRLAAHFGLSRP
ncbi:hypothetical protein [Dokdonella sp.]|uniref:hypothetical protein n=1 Tax=Dokdonella sp. TaxID=2291710 RepID=UPI0037846836